MHDLRSMSLRFRTLLFMFCIDIYIYIYRYRLSNLVSKNKTKIEKKFFFVFLINLVHDIMNKKNREIYEHRKRETFKKKKISSKYTRRKVFPIKLSIKSCICLLQQQKQLQLQQQKQKKEEEANKRTKMTTIVCLKYYHCFIFALDDDVVVAKSNFKY